MPTPIRVLVVDDSAVIRRVLSDVLKEEHDIDVVAAVGTSDAALSRLSARDVDVVTLDVEMPGRSGLDTLEEIRKIEPKLPVIMVSSLTRRAAATTLEALARGATDYFPKPSGSSLAEVCDQIRTGLIPKIRAVCRRPTPLGAPPPPPPVSMPPRGATRALQLVVIGCSTGGPKALAEVFKHIPATFPLPILIVQHMPPDFTRMLAERLDATCPLSFGEATEGERVAPGRVLIAPGDHHLTVRLVAGQAQVALNQDPPENSCRPAVDVLFRSASEAYGAGVLGVVLTGMGSDGLKGAQAIHARGGQVIAQDAASSVVWGMPGFVANAGIAEAVVPLTEVAQEILRRSQRPGRVGAL